MKKTKTLKIGYCRENFSPDGPVRMNYQLTSTYVLEPICVTALSLSQGDKRVLVIGMDLRNIYKSFISKALPMVIEATGLTEDSVIFTCTHNHSCPEVMIYSDDAIRDWGDRIGFPAIVRAAKNAIADEKTVPSHAVINKAIEKFGQDYRYQDKQNPVKELNNRKKDNVVIGRSNKATN